MRRDWHLNLSHLNRNLPNIKSVIGPPEVNKLVTEPTNPAPDFTEPIVPDVMEPISVDAMQTIATAKARIISLREICNEHLEGEVKDAIKNGLAELGDAFDRLSEDVEALMDLGEPLPFMAPLPSILQALQGIEDLGHEARLMVVDWTLFEGVYPLITPATVQDA